jgi:large subunit ribosomal protein L3
LESMNTIGLTTISKGKWFQWPMKRHNTHGMPATHGHKFTRVLGSMGNRKPRRTMRWHPGSGQMGNETTSLRSIKIVDKFEIGGKNYIAVKWSIPGRKNNLVKVYFH